MMQLMIFISIDMKQEEVENSVQKKATSSLVVVMAVGMEGKHHLCTLR